MTTKITLKADCSSPGEPLRHFWSECVGAGRANEGLRAGWLEHLQLVRDHCGFRHVRFHGLFHDDMFVYREDNGRVVYNFQYVDELFDRLLDVGARPFVEFGFCPGDLAREKGTVFWWKGNGSPPQDYSKWGELVNRTVRHWIERYGIAEVRLWYFEIWNEPNLHPFFKGTKGEYFELYRTSVNAIKAIDSALRVGGPATSNFVPDERFAGETENLSEHAKTVSAKDVDALEWKPVWLADFFSFCQKEKLPVDFISCHPYPTDWALDAHGESVKSTRSVDATRDDLRLLHKMVSEGPYPHAEIHLTEWSSSPSPRDFTHDYPQAATFIVKANIESSGLVESLSYWVFTDVFEEGGAGDCAFHGGFGMINYRGIPKPAFHAYRFLNQLGNELISKSVGSVVTRHKSSGKLSALAYHYPPEVKQSAPASFNTREIAEQTLAAGSAVELVIELTGLAAGSRFVVELMDKEHGNAPAVWRAMGAPHSPTRCELALLEQAAWSTQKQILRADKSGRLMFRMTMEPWAVVAVREL